MKKSSTERQGAHPGSTTSPLRKPPHPNPLPLRRGEGEAPSAQGDLGAAPLSPSEGKRAGARGPTAAVQIRLGEIAYARSGDKGSSANVGVIARTPEGFAVLRSYLSAARVEKFFKPLGVGKVIRYELPNLGALNFLLLGILAGGASRSLRTDAQGKTLGQALLEMKLTITKTDLARCQPSRSRASRWLDQMASPSNSGRRERPRSDRQDQRGAKNASAPGREAGLHDERGRRGRVGE
jgi:hypothetical protein